MQRDHDDEAGARAGSSDPAEITRLLHVLGTHMHGLGARFAAQEQLHTTDVQALSVLAMSGGQLTAGELARELELSTGATTRLVDRLEAVGHVARFADEADRRRRHVAITPSAAATAGGFFGSLSTRIEAVLDRYEADELVTVRRFLADVIAATDGHASSDQHPSEVPGDRTAAL